MTDSTLGYLIAIGFMSIPLWTFLLKYAIVKDWIYKYKSKDNDVVHLQYSDSGIGDKKC